MPGPMKTCPNCATSWYDFYENGNWREGYCQHCAFESKEPTTNVSNMPPVAQLTHRTHAPAAKKIKKEGGR